jgi:hypothetical protein
MAPEYGRPTAAPMRRGRHCNEGAGSGAVAGRRIDAIELGRTRPRGLGRSVLREGEGARRSHRLRGGQRRKTGERAADRHPRRRRGRMSVAAVLLRRGDLSIAGAVQGRSAVTVGQRGHGHARAVAEAREGEYHRKQHHDQVLQPLSRHRRTIASRCRCANRVDAVSPMLDRVARVQRRSVRRTPARRNFCGSTASPSMRVS